uniref:Uncharacterized protein n=1 Tax=Arundo donax TaxID=35708 RepID=A0A0A9FTR8_ARUDO
MVGEGWCRSSAVVSEIFAIHHPLAEIIAKITGSTARLGGCIGMVPPWIRSSPSHTSHHARTTPSRTKSECPSTRAEQ